MNVVYAMVFVSLLSCVVAILSAYMGNVNSFTVYNENSNSDRIIDSLCQWNGRSYIDIADFGYDHIPGRPDSLAYFPAYPLLIRCVTASGLFSTGVAAIAISNCFFITAAIVFSHYLSLSDRLDQFGSFCALTAFCFFPATFFFHMAYSESLFVFLLVIFLMGVKLRWRPLYLALFLGCATAARPVGVVLILPLSMYLWTELDANWKRPLIVIALNCLAISGLVAFMIFQYDNFGNAWCFVESQKLLSKMPQISVIDKCIKMLCWSPLLSVYDYKSPAYWATTGGVNQWWLSLNWANPIMFLFISALVFVGCWRKILTPYEAATAFGLLAVPYWLRGYENAMISHGRFAAICVPAYIVFGYVLQNTARLLAFVVLALFIAYFVIYSFQFGAGNMLL